MDEATAETAAIREPMAKYSTGCANPAIAEIQAPRPRHHLHGFRCRFRHRLDFRSSVFHVYGYVNGDVTMIAKIDSMTDPLIMPRRA